MKTPGQTPPPATRRRQRWLWAPASLLAMAAAAVAVDYFWALPQDAAAQYVGRETCARCHEKETAAWTGSDHDRAMDPATPENVLGDFDNRQIDHYGQTSRMTRRGDQFFMATDNKAGQSETFAIKYVLGYRPLQQYLVEFPDGRIQCLPIAWDTQQKKWFHLYPHEPIRHDDPLHWTGRLQNWNYMCADCHTTNLEKNYELGKGYHTTFSEIDVSCETCHGPGSLHVKLAESRSLFWDRRRGYALADLKSKDNRVEVEACAPCHAHRRVVAPGFRPGEKFLDHYLPAMLDGDLYHPDGQLLEEDYEYSSFVQSRMFHEKVRCTNCHDPHTTRIRLPGNQLCGQCHLPSKYDTESHHHHPKGEQHGGLCADCHMPITKYMVVDPRRDHSIRIPRPDLTVSLGVPNACNRCHNDASKGETPQWAVEKCRQWYGEKDAPPHFAYAIAAGRQGKPEALDELIAVVRRGDTRPIVRASALLLLKNYPQREARLAAIDGLLDGDALVRYAAVANLESLATGRGDLPIELSERLTPMLHDPVRIVRTEAVRILASVPDNERKKEDQQAFDKALAEYIAGQEYLADDPGSHLGLGVLYANRREFPKAEAAYQQALTVDAAFYPARINLAMLYDSLGRKDEAEKQLATADEEIARQLAVAEKQAAATAGVKEGDPRPIRQMVEHLRNQRAECNYSLGLLIAENRQRLPDAVGRLEKAAALAPARSRIYYNLGLALQQSGRAADAERVLLKAVELERYNPAYLVALVAFYQEQNRPDDARRWAAELEKLRPPRR